MSQAPALVCAQVDRTQLQHRLISKSARPRGAPWMLRARAPCLHTVDCSPTASFGESLEHYFSLLDAALDATNLPLLGRLYCACCEVTGGIELLDSRIKDRSTRGGRREEA